MACTTIPLFIIGIGILHNHFDFAAINWLGAVSMYMIIVTFFSTFFLAIAYTMKLEWILDNTWPRVIAPLWWMSAGLMIWQKAYTLWPHMGYVMLCSPFTYVAEGMRSVLLGDSQFISWHICIVMLMFFIAINCTAITYGIKKRLDPV